VDTARDGWVKPIQTGELCPGSNKKTGQSAQSGGTRPYKMTKKGKSNMKRTRQKHQIPIGSRLVHQWFSPTRLLRQLTDTAGRYNLKPN